ncbi:uncharacterized protein IWZ02DRAFT_162855 [Phyllosticta citriasiana]|uniref:uncharacterized protein n=1 Tax=Phyllosticta citriasiana TaxID=595635 RepID=UPI0030FDEA75
MLRVHSPLRTLFSTWLYITAMAAGPLTHESRCLIAVWFPLTTSQFCPPFPFHSLSLVRLLLSTADSSSPPARRLVLSVVSSRSPSPLHRRLHSFAVSASPPPPPRSQLPPQAILLRQFRPLLPSPSLLSMHLTAVTAHHRCRCTSPLSLLITAVPTHHRCRFKHLTVPRVQSNHLS